MLKRWKWILLSIVLLLVSLAGLLIGSQREKSLLGGLYARGDFTLLDDQGEFFRLGSLPAKTLALLIFTPDGIPTDTVRPFFEFGLRVAELRGRGIEPFLVSRTHKEIVQNFKRAARFPARLLLDVGGSVGKNAGVWERMVPTAYWSYVLVDREFRVLWHGSADAPMPYPQLMEELEKAR